MSRVSTGVGAGAEKSNSRSKEDITEGYSLAPAHDSHSFITANAIAPALIDTAMIANNPKARPDLIPIGRFGAADEVAAVAVMLARNGYITGQTV